MSYLPVGHLTIKGLYIMNKNTFYALVTLLALAIAAWVMSKPASQTQSPATAEAITPQEPKDNPIPATTTAATAPVPVATATAPATAATATANAAAQPAVQGNAAPADADDVPASAEVSGEGNNAAAPAAGMPTTPDDQNKNQAVPPSEGQ